MLSSGYVSTPGARLGHHPYDKTKAQLEGILTQKKGSLTPYSSTTLKSCLKRRAVAHPAAASQGDGGVSDCNARAENREKPIQGIEAQPEVPLNAVKVDDAPRTNAEVQAHPEAPEIRESGRVEFQQLLDEKVFTWPSQEMLDDIKAKNKKVLKCKMVYARKYESVTLPDGRIVDQFKKWKGRLAAVGTGEEKVLDTCWSTFSPTLGMAALRTVVSLMCTPNMKVRSYDLSGAFLGTPLEREVYVRIPEGVGFPQYEGQILKCAKAIYGLRTSSRDFLKSLSDLILSFEYKGHKFRKLHMDHCIYVFHGPNGEEMILSNFVDDLICGSTSDEIRDAFLNHLRKQWKITDQGELTRFVGLNFVRQDPKTWKVSLGPYIDKIAKRFNVTETSKSPMDAGFNITPEDVLEEPTEEMRQEFRSLIGSIGFASIAVRWDIAYSVSVLSRYLMKPNKKVIEAAKRVVQYLVATRDFYIRWTTDENVIPKEMLNVLWGAVDASYASDVITRRSHGGFLVFMNGGVVSWKSGLQKMVTLSSCESEFVALCSAVLELRYLRQLVEELGFPQENPSLLWEDNKAAIIIASGESSSSGRAKHVDVRFKHVAESIQEGVVRVRYIPTKWNYADIMTKPLGRIEFERIRDLGRRPERSQVDNLTVMTEEVDIEEELSHLAFSYEVYV